jgi:undecaprenyl diphosphate synthase
MHIAILPDGNRRWAKERNLPEFIGHKTGADTVEKIVKTVFGTGIDYLTIWGTSIANMTKRTKEEVDFLFSIFENSFKNLAGLAEIKNARVKVRMIGEWRKFFPESLCETCDNLIEATKENDGPSLSFMLSYSGTNEMLEAIKKLAERKVKDPDFEITRESLKSCLMTAELPPVDLVIRTGGEPHLSDGFMMWDTSDAQLYFTETLWPDFTAEEFKLALDKFKKTERRMGK